jgi:DNA polymerase-1
LEGYEADDILGTAAKNAEKEGFDVTVVSGDRDLLQLATDRILIRIPKTKQGGTEIENYYADDVQEKYGVNPVEFIDMKALMGDTADNIPGVKSIGEKTASKLIHEYQTIENIYENIDTVKPERVKNALIADEENARLSKVLATIHTNAPISLDFADCRLENIYNENSYRMVKMLGFKSMAARFDSDTVAAASDFEPMKEIVYRKTLEELQALQEEIKKLPSKTVIGYANCISDGFFQSCAAVTIEGKVQLLITGEGLEKEDICTFFSWLAVQDCILGVFDLKSILKQASFSYDDKEIYDCMVCAYLLNPLNDSYPYEYVLGKYLDIQAPSQTDLLGKETVAQALSSNAAKAYEVLAAQSMAAYLAAPVLKDELQKTGMLALYQEIEYPLIFVLDDMEKEGISVDEQSLKQYGDELAVSISRLEKEIHEETGEEFNINSPKQLGVILFEKLKLPGGKKTKTGYSTSAEILEKLAPDYPVVSKILEYRQLAKLKSTYADGLRNFISPDGRIHGTFNQTITATGRISSTDPNLQNIPIRMEMGKRIREVFIPKNGCVFVDADYSQIELRILAHMSGDENLIAAYNSEQDIHKITASQVFHVPLSEVTSQLRRNAKAVNFGIVYGISSFGLSQDLSITKKQAAEYIDKYFETYPKVKEFLDQTVEQAKKDGYVTTLYGRRRPIPELKSSNFMQRSFGERAAMNSAVQGTAADIMKIAMIHVYRKLKEQNLNSKILLQVHDELLIETYEEELAQVKEIVKTEMFQAAQLSVSLEVGLEDGKNWLEAH